MNAQQLNTLPRLSSSQVASYPQQSPFVPAVRAAETPGFDIGTIMTPMISLIMMVMIMKMMTKMVDTAA